MVTKGIGQSISWVKFSRNMCQDYHTFKYGLPNPIIGNVIVILIEGDKRTVATVQQNFIIYQNLGWYINRSSEHSELV